MEKIVTIKAKEQEILDIINDHFGLEDDSIVALEELDNQVWCVNVRSSDADEDGRERILKGNFQFMVSSMLDQLALAGKLEDGNYQIDCTW
jgi:phenylpyruvate tautomerase PptA (4-oxalocrotonate tautomerase family)